MKTLCILFLALGLAATSVANDLVCRLGVDAMEDEGDRCRCTCQYQSPGCETLPKFDDFGNKGESAGCESACSRTCKGTITLEL